MSSHHIVRENQEPALIIANGASCSKELLGQLLEWSPYILALDGALARITTWGIKIDAVLGDFDSLSSLDEVIANQQPIEVISLPDQNKTDLEKGIEWLVSKGHHAINIVWATGLRADHTLNNLYTLAKYKKLANLVLFDDYSKVFVLPLKYEKWYPAQTVISLLPINSVEGILTHGLAYPLVHETLVAGDRSGSSNHVTTDGMIHISYTSGDLLMMECHD